MWSWRPTKMNLHMYIELLVVWSLSQIRKRTLLEPCRFWSLPACDFALWSCCLCFGLIWHWNPTLYFAIFEIRPGWWVCLQGFCLCVLHSCCLKFEVWEFSWMCSLFVATKKCQSCLPHVYQRLYLHRISATVITWMKGWMKNRDSTFKSLKELWKLSVQSWHFNFSKLQSNLKAIFQLVSTFQSWNN